MRIKSTEIKIIKSDITELEVGAIVNAANNKLVMGGGVAVGNFLAPTKPSRHKAKFANWRLGPSPKGI